MQFLIPIFASIWLLACGSEQDITTEPVSSLPVSGSLKAETLPGSYIVALKPAAFQQAKSLYFTSFASEFRHYSQQFASLLNSYGIKHTQHIGAVDLKGLAALDYQPTLSEPTSMQLQLGQKYRADPQTGVIMRIDFDSDARAQELLKKWELGDQLWYAEPNEISQLSGIFGDYATQYNNPSVIPTSDPRRSQHDAIKLREAFTAIDQITPNPGRPIIAILDSGVDREHPAFKAASGDESRIWENTAANIGQAGCQDDQYGCNTTVSFKDSLGNGKVFPTGLSSFDTRCPDSPSDVKANCEHGTHVAGIAVGDVANDGFGVCPVCIVLPIRIVGKIEGTGKTGILDSSILAGLKYVSRFKTSSGDAGIKVVNASFGKFNRSKSVSVFVDLIHDELGAIIVAAAGNEDTNRMSYPASLTKVIAVSAVDVNDGYHKATFSNFGSWVDVSAPGYQISSSIPGRSEERKSGTSMAAPIVAGLAGLMVAQTPGMKPTDIRRWILDSADPKIYEGDSNNLLYNPKITGNPNRIPLLGRGIVNAEGAVKEETNPSQVTLYEDYDRVEGFCGTIHYKTGQGHAIWVILLMPILFVAFRIKLSR